MYLKRQHCSEPLPFPYALREAHRLVHATVPTHKSNELFLGYYYPKIHFFLIIITTSFPGDLTDVSAKTASLSRNHFPVATQCARHIGLCVPQNLHTKAAVDTFLPKFRIGHPAFFPLHHLERSLLDQSIQKKNILLISENSSTE